LVAEIDVQHLVLLMVTLTVMLVLDPVFIMEDIIMEVDIMEEDNMEEVLAVVEEVLVAVEVVLVVAEVVAAVEVEVINLYIFLFNKISMESKENIQIYYFKSINIFIQFVHEFFGVLLVFHLLLIDQLVINQSIVVYDLTLHLIDLIFPNKEQF
jgi:hypothetical protein